MEDYDNEFKEIKYLQVTSICGKTKCGAAFKVAVKMQQIRNVGYYKQLADTNMISVQYQAKTLIDTYENVDMVEFKQSAYFNTLSKSSLKIMRIYSQDPNPKAKTKLTFKVRTKIGFYANSKIKITFTTGMSVDGSQYTCRLMTPEQSTGICSSTGMLLTISNAINKYVNDGLLIIEVLDFTNPEQERDYNALRVEIYTQANDLIMSSADDSSNDAVLSIYKTVPIMKCDGQCRTCGKNSYDCLSCYTPNMQPFHSNGQGKCVSKCGDNEYRLEYPSS